MSSVSRIVCHHFCIIWAHIHVSKEWVGVGRSLKYTHAHTNNSHKQPSLKHDFITITHAKRNFHMILSSLTKGARKLQRRVCMHAKATISLLHGIIVSYHLTHTNTCTWPYHSLRKPFVKIVFHIFCVW